MSLAQWYFSFYWNEGKYSMESEKRGFFVYMATSAYHVISKEVENRIFRHNRIFIHKSMYKQPTLTK